MDEVSRHAKDPIIKPSDIVVEGQKSIEEKIKYGPKPYDTEFDPKENKRKTITSEQVRNYVTVPSEYEELKQIICGLGVVLGHVYPLYYQFKGGKGAGPMIGVLLSLFPISLLICFIIWFLTLTISGFVGLSTIMAGITLPICTHFLYQNSIFSTFGFFSILIPIFILYTHRSNIKRMINGNENKFEKIMLFKKYF